MKKCSYCGRQNGDEAVYCQECGTPFPEPSAAAEPDRPRDGTWLDWLAYMLRLAGTIVLIGFLYLLSFGPVDRYCGTRTVMPAPPPMVSGSGSGQSITMVRTVTTSYPAWVSIIYRPVFLILSSGGGNGLYGRYLQWWERPTHPGP